jgi:hypothetical protein
MQREPRMNIEFHYYMIYLIAKYAGLDELDCITVATSSQYVDNNLVAQIVDKEGREYRTIVTQNYGWWSDWFPVNVYIPFHFFPGDLKYPGARRKDGRQHRLNVTPGGAFATELLDRALATKDLYRVGIALHTYADTWAHQNFTGSHDDWNSIGKGVPVPKVGHAEAISQPDKITGRWIDERLEGEYRFIDNETRFLDAAAHIYLKLSRFAGQKGDAWESLHDRLKKLIGPYDEYDSLQKERIANYVLQEELLEYNKYDWVRRAIYAEGNESVLEDAFKSYDKFSWLKDMVLYKTGAFKKKPLKARPDFFETPYFFWHEAAKAHVKEVRSIFKGVMPDLLG